MFSSNYLFITLISPSGINTVINGYFSRLIKLCDDALLDAESSELKIENVNEIVTQVEEAVKVFHF